MSERVKLALLKAVASTFKSVAHIERTMKKQQFQRGRNVLVKCRMCGKLTHSTIDGCSGLDLCRPCRELAELENEHFDGYHTAPNANCPHCHKATP